MAHPKGLQFGDQIKVMTVLRVCAAPDCDETFLAVLGRPGRGHRKEFCRQACRTRTRNPHGRTGRPRGRRPNKMVPHGDALALAAETGEEQT